MDDSLLGISIGGTSEYLQLRRPILPPPTAAEQHHQRSWVVRAFGTYALQDLVAEFISPQKCTLLVL